MGACTIPGKFAIVMELLDGNLEELLFSNAGSKMRLFPRLIMAKEAALGMNCLHKKEPAIIHRDFKLENLMVGLPFSPLGFPLPPSLPSVNSRLAAVQKNGPDLYYQSR